MFVGETISLTDPINRYGVAEDQRALHSIRSASQKIGNLYLSIYGDPSGAYGFVGRCCKREV